MESKIKTGNLTLATDWITAAAMASMFVVCAISSAGIAMQLVHGTPPSINISFDTWLLAAIYVWYVLWIRGIWLRAIVGVLALHPICKVVLHLLGSSAEVMTESMLFFRGLDGLFCLAACVYIIWWFRSKMQRNLVLHSSTAKE
jgi:hypothetical protein